MSRRFDPFSQRSRSVERLDLPLMLGMIILGIFGVLMIYSATRQPLINAGYNPHYYLQKQSQFVLLGIVIMYVLSRIDYHRLEVVSTLFYVLGITSLLGVFVIGISSLGAQRWFSLGFIQVQPSEFMVMFIIIAIATYCQRRPQGLSMYDISRLLVMAGFPLLMIYFQPDLGTCIVLVLITGAMMVVAGVPPRFMSALVVMGGVGVVAAIFLGLLHKYQLERLTSFLNQNSTNSAVARLVYEVRNAKSAIGAGGLHGAGLFHGLQTTLGYVPENRTDFIFTAVGEQLGFVGTLFTVLLMSFIAYRFFVVSRNAKDTMGQLLALGVFVFFSFSAFENIGMTMGIMPVAGIPLPFMSYGGSAAVVFYAAGGVVLSVSRRTNI
jgi:rod shape determining protein RodA